MSIVIVGAGGHGREVLDVVEACGLAVAGFLDDGSPDLEPLRRLDVAWLGGTDRLAELDHEVVLGVGDGHGRSHLAAHLAAVRWAAALVHPLSSLGSDVVLGEGAVVAAGARLTTHIAVGRHVYIGPNAVIGHDAVLEDFVTVLPGATVSGSVRLGARASIGTGANLRQGVRVGEGAVVGAGAVVVRDVAPDTTVVGVPARPQG